MKKLAIMSDLHIDSNQFGQAEIDTLIQTLQEEEVVHLHLAGDISNHHERANLPFLEHLRQHLDVSYNLGNHDMLGLDEAQIEAENFQLLDIGQRQLLAFHGWYDYSFSDEAYDRILRRKNLWFDRRLNRRKSDQEIVERELEVLESHLQTLDSDRLILAMHFVPHRRFTMWHEKFPLSMPFWAVRPFMSSLSATRFPMWSSATPTAPMARSKSMAFATTQGPLATSASGT